MASIESLRNVGVLTKLANDSSHIALNLLAANKERIKAADEREGSQQPQVMTLEFVDASAVPGKA